MELWPAIIKRPMMSNPSPSVPRMFAELGGRFELIGFTVSWSVW